MPLIIDGITHADGDPLLVGGVQATTVEVIQGGNPPVVVWRNNYVADAPTAFTASNNISTTISFAWTLPVDQGVPACSYEVWQGGTRVATAGVGATTASYVTTATTNADFHVVGVNAAGHGANSNVENGSSYAGSPSPLTITASGTFTAGTHFPAGVALTVCICGGGGGGCQDSHHWSSGGKGGGGSGGLTSSVTLSANEAVSATIGAGGTGAGSSVDGGNGGTSSFGGHASAAGGGGAEIYGSAGTGANGGGSGGARGDSGGSASTCGGSFSGGTSALDTDGGGGGAGGFGNGGVGGDTDASSGGNGGTGGIGAGGGGAGGGGGGISGNGGAGGRGQIVISW